MTEVVGLAATRKAACAVGRGVSLSVPASADSVDSRASSGQQSQSSEDWGALGFDESTLPGDPAVLQGIVDDMAYLRDITWSVWQGLDAVVASASSGRFEGATADALR